MLVCVIRVVNTKSHRAVDVEGLFDVVGVELCACHCGPGHNLIDALPPTGLEGPDPNAIFLLAASFTAAVFGFGPREILECAETSWEDDSDQRSASPNRHTP